MSCGILPIDEAVALRWGEVQARVEAKGTPLPVMDKAGLPEAPGGDIICA